MYNVVDNSGRVYGAWSKHDAISEACQRANELRTTPRAFFVRSKNTGKIVFTCYNGFLNQP